MGSIFLRLMNISITAGLMIMIVLPLRVFFRKGMSNFRCLLWILVGIRLLLPFDIKLPLSFMPAFYEYTHNIDVQNYVQSSFYDKQNSLYHRNDVDEQNALYHRNNDELNDSQISNTISVQENNENNARYNVQNDTTSNSVTSNLENSQAQEKDGIYENVISIKTLNIVSFIWFTGMVFLFAYMIISYICLKYRIRMAVPEIRESHCHTNSSESKNMSNKIYLEAYKSNLKIYRTERVFMPFLLGIISPKIYIPYETCVSEEALGYVIAHEQSHIKRRDYLIKPIFFLITAIYWFHPLVWVAYFMMCKDIELACDERVVADYSETDKKRYSEVLLAFAADRHLMHYSPVAFGEKGVKERVKNILDYQKPKTFVMVLGIIICAVIGVCFMTVDSSENKRMKSQQETEHINIMRNENETSDTVKNVNQTQSKGYLLMSWLLEFVENGEVDKLVSTALTEEEVRKVFSYEDFTIENSEDIIKGECKLEYRGHGDNYSFVVIYRSLAAAGNSDSIGMNRDRSQEYYSLSYIGVRNLYFNDFYYIYNEEMDRNDVRHDLREFLNKSYGINDYLSYTLPQGFELNFNACINYPLQYWQLTGDVDEPIQEADFPTQGLGGIGLVQPDSFKFSSDFDTGNRGMMDVDYRGNYNHMDIEEPEWVEGCHYPAIVKEYGYELFTPSNWYDYQLEHPEAEWEEAGISRYWYVFMYDEDNNLGYVVYLNQKYFSKEDTIEFARSVKYVGENIGH